MKEGSGSVSGSIPLTNGSGFRIRVREAQKDVDPVDPDPDSDLEHWSADTIKDLDRGEILQMSLLHDVVRPAKQPAESFENS
jgi:hypothetical protein